MPDPTTTLADLLSDAARFINNNDLGPDVLSINYAKPYREWQAAAKKLAADFEKYPVGTIPLFVIVESVIQKARTSKLTMPTPDVDNLAKGPLDVITQSDVSWDDDKSISAKPNALVLFNPAMNIATLFKQRATGEGPMTLEMAEAITPNSFISKDTPPAILFFGTADTLKAGGDEYVKKATELGLRAEMWSAADMPHGFFNKEPWIQVTAKKMDEFLTSLGYLGGASTLKLPENAPSLKHEN